MSVTTNQPSSLLLDVHSRMLRRLLGGAALPRHMLDLVFRGRRPWKAAGPKYPLNII